MTLRELRRNCKLSQQSLASKLNVSTITYNGWERKTHSPSPENYKRLCDVLGDIPTDIDIKAVGRPIG